MRTRKKTAKRAPSEKQREATLQDICQTLASFRGRMDAHSARLGQLERDKEKRLTTYEESDLASTKLKERVDQLGVDVRNFGSSHEKLRKECWKMAERLDDAARSGIAAADIERVRTAAFREGFAEASAMIRAIVGAMKGSPDA